MVPWYDMVQGRVGRNIAYRNVNQGLNDKGRCFEIHAQTLPKIATLAAVDWLLMRYASVTTSKNKKC